MSAFALASPGIAARPAAVPGRAAPGKDSVHRPPIFQRGLTCRHLTAEIHSANNPLIHSSIAVDVSWFLIPTHVSTFNFDL
jgi:hypothetical protein